MSWPPLPPLEGEYTDEFGVILPEVYAAAQEVWGQAERLIRATWIDVADGQRLMYRAAAAVSRAHVEHPDKIRDFSAYLSITFRRLVLTALEHENGRREKLESARKDPTIELLNGHSEENLDRKILIQQLFCLMDDWAQDVLKLRILGYEYEDISLMLGQAPNVIRSRLSKQLKKLKEQLGP